MPTYQYNARDQKGRKINGKMDATDERHLVGVLRDKKLSIVSISEMKVTRSRGGKRVPLGEIVIFTRQLATMTGAGVPILQATEVLEQQTEHTGFKKVLINVRKSIASGTSLSNALMKEGRVFSDLFVSMVKAGESGGSLDEILDRLATYMEKTQQLINKVKSAMVYPVIVVCMAIAITTLMLVKVIPVFKQMYTDFEATLPAPTLMLMALSDFLVSNFWYLLIGIVVLLFIFRQFISTTSGAFWFDSTKLQMPIFGPIFKKLAISKFSRTLSTLVKSGVPILSALDIVAKTAGNRLLEKVIQDARISVRDGSRMSESLKNVKVMPPLVVRMIAIGETTGALEGMLSKIAEFYENETEAAISALTSILEPVVIAFLGIVVGGMVICMFLPIFSLSQIVSV